MSSKDFFSQAKIRELYINFFESKNHLHLNSFSLVPNNPDKTLLIINAGMAPLKPFFSGEKKPPSLRVTTCQKCIRTNDIENVGKTARHATFFEMLGNFSFGEYFKREAINWAWEFVTQILRLPEEKLFVTVYQEDDEAYKIWQEKLNSEKKIFKMGKEDNFWEIGEGPCGPCSEIYFDRGEKFGCGGKNCCPGCNCDRFIEIWNLVFTQFNKNPDGSYSKLKQKNIDTGMGLERISAVMQGVNSIFEIDTTKEIINKISQAAEINYGFDEKKDISMRIIADHVKAGIFMISDDILISNEGRGYILRKLLRRAICRIKILGIKDKNFLFELIDLVIKIFGGYYKNLVEKQEIIKKVIFEEEKKFNEILENGLDMFMDLIKKAKKDGKEIISGNEVFRLHDTFGFNIEIMKEIAEENEIKINEEEFIKELDEQKEKAREAQINRNHDNFSCEVKNEIKKLKASEFVGYDKFEIKDAKVLMLIKKDLEIEISKQEEFWVIFDKSIFFAEESGQVSDSGILETETGIAEIIGCERILVDKYIHKAKLLSGVIKANDIVSLKLDYKKRKKIEKNHTGTHLLHKVLKEKIFNETKQMGSYIDENYFRFDFVYKKALSKEEIDMIEREVNKKILDGLEIKILNKKREEAEEIGATALFDEKYGEIVRIVNIGDYSIELCSGTHVKNTAEINFFKIISESGVSAGVRRIEAVTGSGAIDFCNKMQNEIYKACGILKADKKNFLNKLEILVEEGKKSKNKIFKLEDVLAGEIAKKICDEKEMVGEINFVFYKTNDCEIKFLRDIGDKVKNRLKTCVVILVAENKNLEKGNLIFERTEDLDLDANEIIKEINKKFGSNGGGRRNYAQIGGLDLKDLDLVIKEIKRFLV